MAVRTVGVEEELLLVDARTGEPRSVAVAVLANAERAATDTPDWGSIEDELQQQQIEIDTDPVTAIDELEAQLRGWRRAADDLARRTGARIAALATSPLPVAPEITVKSRYQAMTEHFGLTTSEQLTCGCHVHVGVESPEEGVAVLDRIRPWLPVLLAISANSPYWQGQDTGYASFRSQAWNRFPSAGPTDAFGSVEGYRSYADALVATGALLDHAMIYFDARLSDRYPTVELRVADVCLNVADTVLVATLARALVDTAVTSWRHHAPAPTVPAGLIRLANWRAARSGLDGQLLEPLTSRPQPAADVVTTLLEHVRPALVEAGDLDRVTAAWAELRHRGTGAATQRAWAADHGLAAMVLRAAGATTD